MYMGHLSVIPMVCEVDIWQGLRQKSRKGTEIRRLDGEVKQDCRTCLLCDAALGQNLFRGDPTVLVKFPILL